MKEQHGRFLYSSVDFSPRLTADGLALGRTIVVVKAQGGFVPNQELLFGSALLAKVAKIAMLLTEGKNAEAIFFAGLVDWRDLNADADERFVRKMGFDPSEARDERGR